MTKRQNKLGHGAALILRALKTGPELWRAREGNMLVEFAFFMPILLIMLAIAFDFGMAMYDNMSLKEAARAGVQYAMANPTDAAGLTQAVADSTGMSPADLTVTSSISCQCPDGTAVDCSGSCAGGATETYATVVVKEPYTTPLPYPAALKSLTLQGAATLRIH